MAQHRTFGKAFKAKVAIEAIKGTNADSYKIITVWNVNFAGIIMPMKSTFTSAG